MWHIFSSESYLAVTDQTLYSTVFVWRKDAFVEFQKIDMFSPLELSFITANGATFLAVLLPAVIVPYDGCRSSRTTRSRATSTRSTPARASSRWYGSASLANHINRNACSCRASVILRTDPTSRFSPLARNCSLSGRRRQTMFTCTALIRPHSSLSTIRSACNICCWRIIYLQTLTNTLSYQSTSCAFSIGDTAYVAVGAGAHDFATVDQVLRNDDVVAG